MQKEVYLDNSATTRICEEALNKYIEVSRECYGNPSSLHTLGFKAEKLLDAARTEVALSLNTNGATVIFTSSGSEANNLAIFGRAFAKERFRRGAKIITTEGEHASVSEPLARLAELGYEIVKIPTKNGEVDLDVLRKEMTKSVVLVTMMMVNNETGAIYDTAAVGKIMRASSPDALLHVDATQSYLKFPFTLASAGADMMTVSSHKIEGPKGVGALVLMPQLVKAKAITPLTLGGGQESGYRSGTENVPAIAAFSEAVRLGRVALRERYAYLSELNSYLLERLAKDCPEVSVTLPKRKVPHIVNITLPNIKSETMLHHLSSFGVYVSSGSACSSNTGHVSSALVAFGRTTAEADSSLRISLSHVNTREDIDALIDALAAGITKLARKK
ncbi:MAG: cysteine desulfurase [Clostridia bacterium]|nr:cysteine desulfurase [Clostridia bacterium]